MKRIWKENIERDTLLLKAHLNGGEDAARSVAMLLPEFKGGPDALTSYCAWISHPDRHDYRAEVAKCL